MYVLCAHVLHIQIVLAAISHDFLWAASLVGRLLAQHMYVCSSANIVPCQPAFTACEGVRTVRRASTSSGIKHMGVRGRHAH